MSAAQHRDRVSSRANGCARRHNTLASGCRIVALILIFHFGIVLGNNEAHAFVVQHPEKSRVTKNAVGVTVSDGPNGADLEARADCILKNSIVGTGIGFRGYGKNVPLAAGKNDRLNILRAGVQTRRCPVLNGGAALGQITAEGLDNGAVSACLRR
jgi:hypothetical protein